MKRYATAKEPSVLWQGLLEPRLHWKYLKIEVLLICTGHNVEPERRIPPR